VAISFVLSASSWHIVRIAPGIWGVNFLILRNLADTAKLRDQIPPSMEITLVVVIFACDVDYAEYAKEGRSWQSQISTDVEQSSAELAQFFEVSEATITNWKTDHPDFLQSIKKGKDEADARVQ
jgi:hypothetical protein